MFFPRVEEQGVLKEVNISAWESEQAAYEWYAQSPGHQDVMMKHTSGMLQTFGNMLASLKPRTSFRYQDRCKQCARIVESAKLGEPPPERCDFCGGQTFQYPLF